MEYQFLTDLCFGSTEDFLYTAHFCDLTFADNGYSVADFLNDFHFVGNHHDGDAQTFVDVFQKFQNPGCCVGVKRACCFVTKQDLWPMLWQWQPSVSDRRKAGKDKIPFCHPDQPVPAILLPFLWLPPFSHRRFPWGNIHFP